MTGAVMPAGLDTVVPQEFTRVEGDRVIVPAGAVRRWRNRRCAGEDLAKGRSGAEGRPRCARPTWACWPRSAVPRCRCCAACAWPSSPPATNCARSASRWTRGCVYDSNRYTLWGMLQRLGVDLIDMGVVRDDPVALEAAFRQAAQDADAVITPAASASARPTTPKQVMKTRSATCCSGASPCGRAGRWRLGASAVAGTTPSSSACPATRWR